MPQAEQQTNDVTQLNTRHYIIVKGARVNNLKNITLAIPRNQLVVITGISGSGKSSLAFDTLFAEGQRMYVESLSSYARQFLGRMEKPDVDFIRGLSPAIAIEQKVNSRNPRSTVGTTTEIYDYIKLLFARIGRTYSPISGQEVKRNTVTDVVDEIRRRPPGEKLMILAPLQKKEGRSIHDELKILLQKGFTRIVCQGKAQFIEEITDFEQVANQDVYVLIDRLAVKHHDEDFDFRVADSVQTAYFEGHDTCLLMQPNGTANTYSDLFEADGMVFEEPTSNFFSFNNPYGACKRCEGFGNILGIDPNLVVPDPSLSVYEGALAPWRGDQMKKRWLQPLIENAIRFDFPIHRSWEHLTPQQQDLIWEGNQYFKGLNSFFDFLQNELHKIQYRVMLSRYRGRTTCPDCKGTRIRKDAGYVKINNKSIIDTVLMPVNELSAFFANLTLTQHEHEVGRRLLTEINNRLQYLEQVGLGYLTLNRLTNTLSGGEFQRIKLATSLGSALVGSMYILDEPSIGLHPRDTQRLIGVLRHLQKLGNTVLVVEHEEDVMRAADQIIDIGPDAGANGGQLVMQANHQQIAQTPQKWPQSHTVRYLTGQETIPLPTKRRKWSDYLLLNGARQNNLKNITVKFPLFALTVVTGVSGSGKSTLVQQILYPALQRALGNPGSTPGTYESLQGSIDRVRQVEFVNQNPIGKSSRSNPVTYIKAYDHIRELMANRPLAKQRNFAPGYFSFNVEGGRCETCKGEGTTKIEMQFMADVYLTCESCKGRRFKQEVLDVTYKEKNIYDILCMTVDEAVDFFAEVPKLHEALQPLQQVGLGYLQLGQPGNTLSGGEAQRVKLAFFLSKSNPVRNGMVFIFDEPTTGLHFHDIGKLLAALQALIDQDNTVIIIEHNAEIIKCADWVIDLGPDGGHHGGHLIAQGTPEQITQNPESHTGHFLKNKL